LDPDPNPSPNPNPDPDPEPNPDPDPDLNPDSDSDPDLNPSPNPNPNLSLPIPILHYGVIFDPTHHKRVKSALDYWTSLVIMLSDYQPRKIRPVVLLSIIR